MSQENVEVVEAIHSMWNAGESTSGLIDADLEYVNPPDAIETGTRYGRSALGKVREVYPDYRFEVERIVDEGDDVAVVGLFRGTSTSGVSIVRRQGHVWTLAGGRAVRFGRFNDHAEALKAVGLEE
jgi:ketosteroid isomerase-like protein